MTPSSTNLSAVSRLRNVAIIAHVDHGKTSLVDQLLKQSGMFRSADLEKLAGGQHNLIMDTNPLERERGITILSKNCALRYETEGDEYHINVIDTPGHADFGGEVERVLRMADGCLLLVDAFEGPMPQTRFVLGKAIAAHLRPIVVINKCDRPEADPQRAINKVFDLLVDLGAEEAALDFPVIYASAKEGWATDDLDTPSDTMRAIFDVIVRHVPAPTDDLDAPLQMLITTLDASDYVGRIGVGRVYAGSIKRGQSVTVVGRDGTQRTERVVQLQRFDGLGKVDTDEVGAGDLCAIIGFDKVDIGDTICDPAHPAALPPVTIDEPTLSMLFRVNDSPFAGKEGDHVTSRKIRERLDKELERNVAMRVEPGERPEEFIVSGRGMLHLGVLLETMRREGFELAVGKPRVVLRERDGVIEEPIEILAIDVPNGLVGAAMELVGTRKGEARVVEPLSDALTHLEFEIPARGLIGLRSRLLTATQGEAIMSHTFDRFERASSTAPARRPQGVMIATETGAVTGHAVEGLHDRGFLFVEPGDRVFAGQIVGEHNRDNDIVVNITREKQLTNIRQSTKEATVTLKAPRKLPLEVALEYIEDDELVEITPKSVRLRKRILDEGARRRHERQSRDKTTAGA